MTRKDYALLAQSFGAFLASAPSLGASTDTIWMFAGWLSSDLLAKHENFDIDKFIDAIRKERDGEA